MGRNRKEVDRWMPAKLYRGKSAYEYRPKPGVCIRVCALDCSRPVVMRRFAEEYERFHADVGTLSELVADYFKGEKYRDLAAATKGDYAKYWGKLKPVFGHVKVDAIKPEHIRIYMDKKGATSKTQANRHHAFLSAVFAWGYQRGRAKSNPCRGVSRFRELSRERYIEDWEYQAVYDAAPTPLRAAMEISYLCAARQGDVIKLTKSAILAEGILIRQGKTNRKQIKGWTPRLRVAIALASSIETKTGSIYVIPTPTGTAYTSDGFRTMWHRAREDARKATGKALDFTFHDVKAKGVSDFEGSASQRQEFADHADPKMTRRYDRKTKVVSALDLPNISDGKNSK